MTTSKAELLVNITRDTWNIHLHQGDIVDVEHNDDKTECKIHIRGPLYVHILSTKLKFIE